MTPEQKIKATILHVAWEYKDDNDIWEIDNISELTEDNVDDLYHDMDLYDIEYDFRGGEVETGLPTEFSRHYECEEVAAKMFDSTWVGWTYWHGGGKHGEPESIPWKEYAYNLSVKEEEVMTIKRTFTKIED